MPTDPKKLVRIAQGISPVGAFIFTNFTKFSFQFLNFLLVFYRTPEPNFKQVRPLLVSDIFENNKNVFVFVILKHKVLVQ